MVFSKKQKVSFKTRRGRRVEFYTRKNKYRYWKGLVAIIIGSLLLLASYLLWKYQVIVL